METEYFKNKILPLKQKLFRKALYITQSQADAEDIVQEVMMRMWANRKECPKINNIESFCSSLVRNLSIDRIKQVGFQNEAIDQFPDIKSSGEIPIENLIRT
ncbi:MAG: RNA polymerase sigma factor, partial [Bacteroidaceae bacterium]|nr:RNA polymerase sigma factor [Bacteroidaceae bacterium]